jgi:hypothetical protein
MASQISPAQVIADARAWENATNTEWRPEDFSTEEDYQKHLTELSAVEFVKMLDGCEYIERLEMLARLGKGIEGAVGLYRMRDWPRYILSVKKETPSEDNNPPKEYQIWSALTKCDAAKKRIVPLITAYYCKERNEYAFLMPFYGRDLKSYLIETERAILALPNNESWNLVLLDIRVSTIVKQMADTLDWLLNTCGYFHGDAHYGNWVMDYSANEPFPRLIDFGRATPVSESKNVFEDESFQYYVFQWIALLFDDESKHNIANAIRKSSTYEEFQRRGSEIKQRQELYKRNQMEQFLLDSYPFLMTQLNIE